MMGDQSDQTNDNSLRRIAWVLAVVEQLILAFSGITTVMLPGGAGERYWELIAGTVASFGAPILGLLILRNQLRNRIGWLLLIYGAAISFFSLAQSLYILEGGRPNMPSDPLLALLILSETSALIGFASMGLLMLWFPDGQPPSPRWRFLHWWLAASMAFMFLSVFQKNVTWTPEDGLIGGSLGTIRNPIGFIPDRAIATLSPLFPIAFFSILFILLLASLSVIARYRSANPVVRAQLRWFILGSLILVISLLVSIILVDINGALAGALSYLGLIAVYLAIGIAITRYRLYEIDLLIRRTLVYGALTVALGLVFFGGVVLLQQAFGALTGTENSPVAIVISTLAIAALFNPLRRRVQDFIDRRFYRKKYNAEQALKRFSELARNETDIELLKAEIMAVVQETMQPEKAGLWLREAKR